MARGISLHLGLNHIDPAHYGTDGRLRGCVNDARSMASIAATGGFVSVSLLDEAATSGALLSGIRSAAQSLRSGDLFLVTYAGHGAELPDKSADEPMDQTLCTFDRMVLDDELYEAWKAFEPGVRVLFVSDSCHSGTVARDILSRQTAEVRRRGLTTLPVPRCLTPEVSERVFENNEALYVGLRRDVRRKDDAAPRCSGILLAACQDDQTAGDLQDHGVFTSRLLEVWANGSFDRGAREFLARIRGRMPGEQVPNFFTFGATDGAFESERPFTIASKARASGGDAVPGIVMGDGPFDFGWRQMKRDLGGAGGDDRGSRCMFEVDIDRSVFDGKNDEDVFKYLSTRAVDSMMQVYLGAKAMLEGAPRSRGFGVDAGCSTGGGGECHVGVHFGG